MKYLLAAAFSVLIMFSCKTSKSAYELRSNVDEDYIYSTILVLEEESFEIRNVKSSIFSKDIIKVETEKIGILHTKEDTFTLLNNTNLEIIESYYYGDSNRNYLYKYSNIVDSTGNQIGLIKGPQINKLNKNQLKAILQK